MTFVSDFVVEQPYAHSTGPSLGRFLTALRDECVIYGRRCDRCDHVCVPARDFCDTCGTAAGAWAPVGSEGIVTGFTVVSAPMPLAGMTPPFALARIMLDGAGTELVHFAALDGLARGARVRPRWASERTGSIRDIECFTTGAVAEPLVQQGEPVDVVRAHPQMPFTLSAGALTSQFMEGIRRGEIIGNQCPSCGSVYVPPRGSCSTCWRACEGSIPVDDAGSIVSYVVVNVPFYGQQVQIPYVLGLVLLDGASSPIFHLVGVAGDDGVLQPCEVRAGLRVKAVWRSQRTGFINEDIDHFTPEEP